MSGGTLIGQCLVRNLGCPYASREELMALVNTHGEIANRVMASIGKAARDYRAFSELRRPYKILMRLALLEYARRGNLAYFGYSGHLLLPPVNHFIRVRLNAPLRLRMKTTMERLNLSEKEAMEYIERVDEERTRWARFMYGADIRDPRLYDVCVNLRRLSIHGACELLAAVTRQPEFQATPESLAQVEDLYLATRVEAALVTREATCDFEVAATATGGRIVLEGPYLEASDLDRVLGAARSVEGVEAVEYKPGYAPSVDYSLEDDQRTPV
jgi:hypothetical protein